MHRNLRTAIPSPATPSPPPLLPRGKTEERELLRKPDTNRIL